MSVFISHGRVFCVVLIHHSYTKVNNRKTTAVLQASIMLLTASKQNLHGIEDKNMLI